jgi:CheY-like chemotaxis protein
MANVLIVDDEEMDRFLGSRIVEDAGHTPFFAGDGEAALQMYKDNDIALVITDLRMPKVDGLRLIRDLIAHDPEAAIIAVSGAVEDLEEAERFGALAGLMKPVEPQTLIEKVQGVLDHLSGGGGRRGDMWGSGW